MDLIQLIELSRANPLRATIETTVTTGFELVAINECQQKFGKITEICKARGRIYFNIDISQIQQVHSMRSVDNIFVVADAISSIGFNGNDMAEDMKLIERHVNKPDWRKAVDVWKNNASFQGICYPTKEHHVNALREEQVLKDQARIEAELTDDSANESSSANEKEEMARIERALSGVGAYEMSQVDDAYIENQMDTTDNDKDRSDDVASLPAMGPLTQKQHEMVVARLKARVARAYRRLDTRSRSATVLKYRVTCYRSGSHTFGSQEAAYCFGGELQDLFQWVVDLELFDMEVILSIKLDQVYVSVALTKESKHRRNIHHFGPTTLRATVCYCLLHLGEPRVGDIVVDPMCGGGSIPIEGMLAWPGVYHIGGESHPKAVARSYANVRDLASDKNHYIDLATWDATNLPLRDSSVDLFAIDLPFGRRSGSKKDNRVLYLEVLRELARVVRKSHGRAVLLTEDRRSFTKALPQMRGLWKLKKTLGVNIGGLEAAVYVLKRSGK